MCLINAELINADGLSRWWYRQDTVTKVLQHQSVRFTELNLSRACPFLHFSVSVLHSVEPMHQNFFFFQTNTFHLNMLERFQNMPSSPHWQTVSFGFTSLYISHGSVTQYLYKQFLFLLFEQFQRARTIVLLLLFPLSLFYFCMCLEKCGRKWL